MPTYQTTPQFEHGQSESTGILVVNLGTPDAPTPRAVRRFLKQFLSDPRVIELPRLLWWLILNLVILVIRPRRSAAAYQKVWTDQGSPLMVHSLAIANELAADLQQSRSNTDPVHVELAMTYGNPSIDDALDRLIAKGVRRVLTLPLYPQYSGTTTAAVFDAVSRKISRMRWIPETRFINNYHDAPEFIAALAKSVEDAWTRNGRGEKLLMSFHGVPTSTLYNGDPYHCQCQKTARLLAEHLGLGEHDWILSFQSRVGRDEWLSPFTDQTVKALAESGLKKLDVVCPGFSTDCLETLEEIALQNAEFFRDAGGETLHYIPALNANPEHIAFLSKLVAHHIDGWRFDESGDVPNARSAERAIAMGAIR